MKPPVLPVLLGLTLCGIGSAMLYIYFKTKDDENEKNDEILLNKKLCKLKKQMSSSMTPTTSSSISSKKNEVEENDVIHEIIVSNSIAPIIVGRNLSNLKLIEEDSGAKIWFKDKNDGNQICFVKGKLMAVKKCEVLIQQTIKRAQHVTEEINVPQTACGKIMGRCGDSLQEICRKSKAKVSVDSGDRGDGKTRRVIITGNQSQVNIAKVLIEEKVKEDAEARKLIQEVEAKREPRGGVRTPTSLTPATSRESIPPKSEKLLSTSSDGQLEVYVSAVASPARFWLQLVGPQSSELDNLVENMTEYYNKQENLELHKIKEPYLGQIVAAMFKFDSKWYRAEIISILPNEFRHGELVLDLYFVDYGDSEYVGPHEICELRTDFLMLRFQAIECYLAHVQPAVGNDVEIWDEPSISRFEELTHVAQWKKMLSRTVTYKERTKGDTRIRREGSPVPGIELYDSNEGRDINVADELVAEGYATFTDEAKQERSHLPSSYNSAGSSQSSSVYEINQNGQSNTNNKKHNGDISNTTATSSDTNHQTKPIDQNQNNLQTNGIHSNTQSNNDNQQHLHEAEKFSAIYENTTNENYENIQKDSSTTLFESERNGNYINSKKQRKLFPKDWNEMMDDERNQTV